MIALGANSSTIEDPTWKGFPKMSSENGVSAALVTALLAAGIAGPNAIDEFNGSPGEGKQATEARVRYGSRNLMPPSREVAPWALRQLSELASDQYS